MRIVWYRFGLGLLLAPLSAGLLSAQAGPGGGLIAGFVALGFDHGDPAAAGAVGLELRLPLAGRMSASVTAARWWFMVGCDLVVGAPCDETAWSADGGVLTRLTPENWSWELAVAARVGRLYYSADRGVWDPSLGLDAIGGVTRRIGWQVGLSYHALADSRPAGLPYQPSTADHVVIRAGLHVPR